MSEQNGQAAAQPASAPAQTAAQPAQTQFNVPQGYSLVAESDLQTLRRHEQSVRGFQPLYERLNKSGIKSEKDWDSLEPIVKTARERKIDAKAFSSMFSPEADADLGTANPAQSLDIEALKKQMREEATQAAYEVPYAESRKHEDKFVETCLTKLLGDEPANDFEKAKVRGWLKDYLWENRGLFPEDHPLKGKVQAFTDELGASALKHFSELKAKAAADAKGAEMNDRATAANTTVKKVGTAAGGGTSASGKPNTTDNEMRPGGLPSRAAAEAAAERLRAGRAVSGRRR